jgi:hypothetical protein
MKRSIMLAMVLVMIVSIGGCFVPWDRDDRGGRDGGHERDGGHDRGGEHDRDGGHDRH